MVSVSVEDYMYNSESDFKWLGFTLEERCACV